MITEYTYSPRQKNDKPKQLIIALLFAAAAFAVLYIALPSYKGVVGLVALVAITAAVFLYTKYISSEYFYDIILGEDGAPLFVVRQKTGKRESTMCRIELSRVLSLTPMTKEERAAHKTEAGYVRYVYTPTMSPELTYFINVASRYEKAEIIIEADGEFIAMLERAIAYARENFPDEE